jgi:LEA14-like dessication related protein
MAKKNDVATKGLAIVGGLAILGLGAKVAIDKIISNVYVNPGNPAMDNTPFANGYLRTDVPLTITNQNAFPIGVRSFFGNVTYGEVLLGEVALPVGFHVPSGSTRIVNLDFNIPIQQVMAQVLALIQQGDVFNAVLNKIELNGVVVLSGNFLNAQIPLHNIAIPIV